MSSLSEIKNYRIGRKIGQGGMGEVYECFDNRNKKYAIKILKKEFAQSPVLVERFHREAKIMFTLNHPNIVKVFDMNEEDGIYYILMEYIEGESLQDKIESQKKISFEEAIDIITQVCEGLSYAHHKNIIHRDIKPSNILIDKEGKVKLADFGIAKIVGNVALSTGDLTTAISKNMLDEEETKLLDMTGLTGTGTILGTYDYMSPEQKEGKKLTFSSDIYSLGVVLYKILTGKLPSGFELPGEKNRDIPAEMDGILKKCLAPTIAERYQKVEDFMEEIFSLSGENIKIQVESVSEIKEHSKGGKYFTISGKEIKKEPNTGTIFIHLWESHQLTAYQPLIWKNCVIRLLNLKRIKDKNRQYASTENTLLIIEPSFLIDTSVIAKCFIFHNEYPELFFLNNLIPSETNEKMIRGILVNECFDKLLNNPEEDTEKIYKEAEKDYFKKHSLDYASLGETGVRNIKKEVENKEYLKTLKKIAKDYRENKKEIEPFFCSDLYGLQGRLDVLLEFKDESNRKDILEIKTGNAPNSENFNIWEEDKIQVVCYRMLIESVYGNNVKGKSMVIYSSDSEEPVKEIKVEENTKRKILYVRNRIVFLFHKLLEDDLSLLNNLTLNNFPNLKGFNKKDMEEFEEAYRNSKPIIKKYYNQTFLFIIRELVLKKLNAISPPDRNIHTSFLKYFNNRNKFNTLRNLKFKDFNSENSTLRFEIPESHNHKFREDDWVFLYPDKGEDVNPARNKITKGSIENINETYVEIAPKNKYLNPEEFKENEWIMQEDSSEETYWKKIKSSFNILSFDEQRFSILLGEMPPKKCSKFPINYNELDDEQKKDLLERSLSAEDYFLLQGPPGTGKTAIMLKHIVKNLEDKPDEKIVILAHTNRAVEEICKGLKKEPGVQFLKLGYTSEENSEITEEDISRTNVFVFTLASFYSRLLTLKEIVGEFSTLLVDEAAQTTEPDISGILFYFKRFILIGDHKQLPAVILQDKKSRKINDPDLIKYGIVDLGQSLFERLHKICREKKWDYAYGMLETHYRMHQDISFLLKDYYNGKIKIGKDRQSAPLNYIPSLKTPVEKLLSTNRCIFIETNYYEKEKDKPYNKMEVEIISKILKTIKENTPDIREKVGIITPWRAQIEKIRETVNSEEIIIDTVERYQGSEKNIIIISLAINNENWLRYAESPYEGEDENSKKVDRKFLVAISRAKEQVIILGNSKILYRNEFYKDIIEKIKKQGGYIDYENSKRIFEI